MILDGLQTLIKITSRPTFRFLDPGNERVHMALVIDQEGQYFGLYWQDLWELTFENPENYNQAKPLLIDLGFGDCGHSQHPLPHYFDRRAFHEKVAPLLEEDIELKREDLMSVFKVPDQDRAKALIDRVRNLSLPIIPENNHEVMDGTEIKVKIYGKESNVSFSYRSFPPDSWNEIDKIHDDVWELVMDESIEEDEEEEN